MASGVRWVLLHEGVPTPELFGDTRGQGSPVIIDQTRDIAYYLHPTMGVRPLGGGSGIQNYQFACSDLGSDIVATTDAGYVRIQTALSVYRVRAALLYPSVSGPVSIQIRNRDTDEVIIEKLEFAPWEAMAETDALLITEFPDNSILVVDIIVPGTGAKGLQVAIVGVENVP